MAIDLQQFLRYWRFQGAPFPPAMAEQEGPALTPVFIPQPWFYDEVVGDPQRPTSCVVYAGQGMGKSAHRMELARLASSVRGEPALVVLADSGAALPAGDQGAEAHISWICRLTLLQIHAQMRQQPALLSELQREDPLSYDLLWLYWQHYAPVGTYGRPPPSAHSERLHDHVRHTDGGQQTLRRLADLARALKFASVYLIFDSLDEGLDPGELADLARRLRPLTSKPTLLHACGFAFKFFLPLKMRPLLADLHADWLHRMPEHTISYRDEDLRQILSRRLEVSSRMGPTIDESYVNRFAQLCVPNGEPESAEALDLEDLLIAAAAGTPRSLLRLAGEVIRRHCALAERPDEPISRAAVEAALAALTEKRSSAAETPPLRYAQHDNALPPSEIGIIRFPEIAYSDLQARRVGAHNGRPSILAPPPAPPLCFFDDGRVTLGEHMVTRLTGKLYQAMHILWTNRGHLVNYADFEETLYGDDLAIRLDPKSSREKLIRRLRQKLEEPNPNASASRTYVDVTDGIGLTLRNYQESEG